MTTTLTGEFHMSETRTWDFYPTGIGHVNAYWLTPEQVEDCVARQATSEWPSTIAYADKHAADAEHGTLPEKEGER